MLNEINLEVKLYQQKWQRLVAERQDQAFFTSLKPTAVGWKVADRAAYNELYAAFHDQSDRMVETWMNGRWIAKLHLNQPLTNGVEIIKIMQRRPGSDDALGLDHLDFYSPQVVGAEMILQAEPALKWSQESNDVVEGYDWLSIWFDDTEAKLKSDTVIDVVTLELQQINDKIKA